MSDNTICVIKSDKDNKLKCHEDVKQYKVTCKFTVNGIWLPHSPKKSPKLLYFCDNCEIVHIPEPVNEEDEKDK